MTLAYRESVTPGMLRLMIAILCVLLALLTLYGPLDTSDSLTPLQRLAYFGMCGAMQVPICYAAAVLTLYLTRNLRPRRIALALTATSLVVAAPCAAIAYTAYGLFHAGEPPDDSLSFTYLVCALNLGSATALGYYVLCLRLRRATPRTAEDRTTPADAALDAGRAADATHDPVTGGIGNEPTTRAPTTVADQVRHPPATAAERVADEDGLPSRHRAWGTSEVAKGNPPLTRREPEAPAGQAPAASRPASVSHRHSQFFKRLSADVGRDVVCLRVSGHYVEVTTSAGSDVILMRLADAVDALGGLGMQIHRSYWAAYHHMNRLVRREGRMLLRLSGDREIPVSRPYLKAVRAVVPTGAVRRPTLR